MGRSGVVLAMLTSVVLGCSSAPATPSPSPTPARRLPARHSAPAASPTPSRYATPAVIEVGSGPCAISELDGAIWVTNYGDGTLTRIDPATNVADPPIQIGTNPCGMTALDGALWMGLLGSNEVVRFDPRLGTMTDRRRLSTASHGTFSTATDRSGWRSRDPTRSCASTRRLHRSARLFDRRHRVTGLAVTADQVWVANTLSSVASRASTRRATVSPARSSSQAAVLVRGRSADRPCDAFRHGSAAAA